MVRRLLPALPTQSVGPFVFFDHFGPITTHPDDNHDVRPHPHIGLSTVTYLFDGRNAASGQPRLGTTDRARRDQLDDGRDAASSIPSVRPRTCAERRTAFMDCSSGRRSRRRTRKRIRRSFTRRPGRSRVVGTGIRARVLWATRSTGNRR
jgi:hypothetical protein